VTHAGDGAPSAVHRSWMVRAAEALASISESVCFLDSADRFRWLNTAAERLLARPAGELVGRQLWVEFPDLADSPLREAYRAARRTDQIQHLEFFYGPLDRWLEVRAHPHDGDLVVFFRDVHERRALDEERAAESSLIRAVLNALPARTAILDADGTILTTNRAWAAGSVSAGRPFASEPGANYLEAVRAAAAGGDRDAGATVAGLEAVLAGRAPSFSLDYATRTGGRGTQPRWWHLQVFPVDDGPRVVVTHTDITERVSAERRAAWQARHDHLTALPNRAALHEVIADALAQELGRRVTVLYMDVDGFKQVNDSLGHAAGDLLLRDLAARLLHRTRPTDVVGRLGGDEFVVVARDCDSSGGEALAQRFRAVFDEPFELAGTRLRLTVSVGIATSDAAHTRPEDLLRDADAAMYAAKATGRNQHLVFTPALRTALEDRWQIASRLRDAAALGELTLHWQPVVQVASGEVTGCEALLRWDHPLRGPVSPAEFVPIAEEDGSIVPITRWLLRAALGQAADWAREGLELTIAVNVSAVHLSSGTLVDDVLEVLDSSGVPAGRLMLELTETAVARDPAQATAQLLTLREHGVRTAIDDFGTGYSALATLASLPADVLKVDRALLGGAPTGCPRVPEVVLGAVAALGAALDMQVLAEGVETPRQLDLVRSLGCTYVQGNLFSPPLPAARLSALLHEGRRRTGVQRLPADPAA
jgi:diguanylate cyclase (GGDEF)-like protein